MQRSVFNNWDIGDDQTGRVCTGIACNTFHFRCSHHQFFDLSALIYRLLEFRNLINAVFQRDRFATLRHLVSARYQFTDPIHFGKRHIHHTANVADCTFRAETVKGDDLGHMILTVLVGTILQQLVAFIILNVQINIWHGNTPRIQETLKNQLELQRFNWRDSQCVSHHRTSPGTTDVVPPVTFFCVIYQILHDQEVGVKPHGMNDIQLMFQAVTDNFILGVFSITPDQALFALFPQLRLVVFTFRKREDRQMIAMRFQIHKTAFRNFHRIGKCTGNISEELLHFLR